MHKYVSIEKSFCFHGWEWNAWEASYFSKFKSSSETPTPQKPESRVHSGDVATQDMISRKQAKAKAMARKAEIRAEIQNEKQDK